MYRQLLLILVFVFAASGRDAAAQGCLPNFGFEEGNFNHWETFASGSSATGPVRNRHTIVSAADGVDSIGWFPKLCPFGGNYSARLGNQSATKQFEQLAYEFVVPNGRNDFAVTYFFALVLSEGRFDDFTNGTNAFFEVKVYDQTSFEQIQCNSYRFSTRNTIGDYAENPLYSDIFYKNWTGANLNLFGRAGHQIRIELGTFDCTHEIPANDTPKVDIKHFAYAYFDVLADCENIGVQAPYCTQSNALVLNAPMGYQRYTWYNSNFTQVVGQGQSVTITPPPATSGFYWVVVKPYPGFGCADTLKAVVKPLPDPPPPQVPDTIYYCRNQGPFPISGVVPLPGYYTLWYTAASGGLPSPTPPAPATTIGGIQTWWVAQKTPFGCESSRKQVIVNVVDSWELRYSVSDTVVCFRGNSVSVTNLTRPLPSAPVVWVTGDGMRLTLPPNQPVAYNYARPGTYSATVQMQPAGVCSQRSPVIIRVLPNPLAAIDANLPLCIDSLRVPARENALAPGDSVIGWWWSVDGVVSTTRVPAPMLLGPGPMIARLAVRTREGCRSDTAARLLTIGQSPVARFSVETACSNVPAMLSDSSFMPPPVIGASVTGWHWSVNGVPLSDDQHPAVLLPGGSHHLQLVAESDQGCRSAVYDSLIYVRPAPVPQLRLTDSCAVRGITLSVSDGGNTGVSQWYWSFGTDGFRAGDSVQQRRFAVAGSYPVAIASESRYGCRDTLRTHFTIYDINPAPVHDTLAAFGQAVQLSGGGPAGTRYLWSPATGLSSDTAAAPVALADHDQAYSVYAISPQGCDRRSFVLVRRMLGPDIYVPDAFTPNNDGKNDILRPITAGIRELRYFSVFDRNGQRVYHSSDTRSGWDGRLKGIPLGTSTFVYVVEGVTYDGRHVLKKGTVTLIR
ncbi:MAG: gliding motility-associated C-terminal domain-containing protein [Chitinophagaceae bacterium]|nr:MAG: gliding motility-associated C-terminal domain-containing protein [Chitinophagaceae bacterium]